jgi:hypothetical protein
MKQKIFIPFYFLAIFAGLYLSSCTKENTPPLASLGFTDSTETKDSLDNTNFGIYKGVLTGTTGRIKFHFRNGDTIMKAVLTVDSLSDTLTCTETWVRGEPVIAAYFQGRISSLTFTTDATGENASIDNIIIRNRINVFGVIAHERSNEQVYCYETKFTGNQKGNFNFIKYGNLAQGLARNEGGDTYIGKGLVTGNIFKLNLNGPLGMVRIFQGGIEGITLDYISGSWIETSAMSGVFNGTRTQ